MSGSATQDDGPGRLRRLLPPTPLAGALSLQSGLYAMGSGVFLTGSAVYFTRIVGLSAGAVGLGISIAGLTAFLMAVPAGRLVDRVGALRGWALAAAGEALVYFCYPWVRGFAAFAVALVLLALMQAVGNAGRGAYTLSAIPRGDRVRALAFVRSSLNIGFTLGALVSGLALAADSRRVILAVPVLTGALLLLNALLISRLRPVERVEPVARVRAVARARNTSFVRLSIFNGMVGVNQVLLAVVFPLWVVQRTDAPVHFLAWFYGTNTIMAVLLQVPAARGSETVAGALRAARLATACIVLACVVAMTTRWTHGPPTVALMWVAYVAVTGAELFSSAASWGLSSELSDPGRRGEYQGVWSLGTQLQTMIGPAACTWLAVTWRPDGYLVIAASSVVACLLMPRAASGAREYLARSGGVGITPDASTSV